MNKQIQFGAGMHAPEEHLAPLCTRPANDLTQHEPLP